jgi:hypothetical protein
LAQPVLYQPPVVVQRKQIFIPDTSTADYDFSDHPNFCPRDLIVLMKV